MKGLALMLWLLALSLFVYALQPYASHDMQTQSESLDMPRLLAIAPALQAVAATPSLLGESLSAAAPEVVVTQSSPVIASGCSRLGLFPTAAWAERVAIILSKPSESRAMPVAAQRMVEEVQPKPWRIQRVNARTYYLQFDAWSFDELAERMATQRELLRRLLSVTAIPEAC